MKSDAGGASGGNHLDDRPDDRLARDAAGGDRDAFALLIDRHYDRIYRLAYGWTGTQSEAEDVAQDIVVKLARVIGQFEGQAKFTTWLHRLVLNHLHDQARAQKRRRIDNSTAFEDLQLSSNDVPADRQMEAKQGLAAVMALPEKLRDTVLLVHWQGLTHEVAAEVLGCKGGTVSWRLNEARKQLEAALNREQRS